MITDIKNSSELNFRKLDGILAIFMTMYISITTIISWYIIVKLGWLDKFAGNFENRLFARFIFYIPLALIELFPIFIILKYRNQSLKSVGINKNKVFKQIIIGISLYFPLFLLNLNSSKILSIESISIWSFMYMLIEIALVEEIIFRGYVQQRLRGLIDNRYINLFIGAFIFGIMHLPFTLIRFDNISFIEIFLSTIPRMIMHIYFVGVFKAGDNSILSSTITHAINNFINTL